MKITEIRHNQKFKRAVILEASVIVKAILRKPKFEGYDVRKCCLFWAGAVVAAAARNGFDKFQLQGGSARWRVVKDELDDGVSPTHYGYEYTAPENAIQGLGEVHYWAAVHPKDDPAGRGLIVDLTTEWVPELAAEKDIKVSCYPPNAVWCTPAEIDEEDWKYAPLMEPTISGFYIFNKEVGSK